MRRLHVPLLTHVAVILTTLTLAACTSDQPAIPASSPNPTSEASPSATVLPRRSPTAIPTPPISDNPPPATITRGQFKTHIVNMRTGEVSALYEGNQHYLVRDQYHPTFTPDGTAVWLSIRGWDGAKRFALDGTVTDEIEGAWAVIESTDARARAYYLHQDGEPTTVIVAERDGVSTRIDGDHALPQLSPSGTELVTYEIGEERNANLVIVDLLSGDQLALATDLDFCACDQTPHPDWSPSGSYIAYYDFAGNEGDSQMGGASFLLPMDGSSATLLVGYAPPGDSAGWLAADAVTERLVVESFEGLAVLDARTGVLTSLLQTSEDRRLHSSRVVSGRYVRAYVWERNGGQGIETTILFDGITGIQLAQWEFWGDPAMTPAGPAFTTRGRSKAACDGLLVIHPSITDSLCIESGRTGAWSPSGSSLAITRPGSDGGIAVLLWRPDSGLSEVATFPGADWHVEWNPQGTHLLVTSGMGL